MKSERILLLALAAALGFGCLLILLPFVPAMLWAAILVYSTWPFYARLKRYLPASLAAFILTLLVALICLLPLINIGLVAAKEARVSQDWIHLAVQDGLPPAPEFLSHIPIIGTLIVDFWNNSADDLGGAAGELQPLIGTLAHSGLRFLYLLTHGLIGIVVALFVAFFFYLSGQQIIVRIRLLLVRIMTESRVEHLLGLVAGTVRGVVFGIVGTAAMQGVLYAIGFEVAGAPQPILLASFAGIISIVPAGAIVIYVPLCLFLFAKGHVLVSILLAAYCFVVVGGADSIVRPWLIARGASLPYMLTLAGVLGGAIAFGALGIFLGPVLLTLGLAVAEEFAGQPRGAWRQP
ncbi:MAG: AI-2E family transporter [Acidocella sp.]|jgi:predicted PurR-regulated permease PerM|nr:AI-2E family transporter [Acidocella sp.]